MKHCTNCGQPLEAKEQDSGTLYTCKNRQCGGLCGYTLSEATFNDAKRLALYGPKVKIRFDFHTGEPRRE